MQFLRRNRPSPCANHTTAVAHRPNDELITIATMDSTSERFSNLVGPPLLPVFRLRAPFRSGRTSGARRPLSDGRRACGALGKHSRAFAADPLISPSHSLRNLSPFYCAAPLDIVIARWRAIASSSEHATSPSAEICMAVNKWPVWPWQRVVACVALYGVGGLCGRRSVMWPGLIGRGWPVWPFIACMERVL